MTSPTERLKRPVVERYHLVLGEVEVVVPFEGEEVRQAVGHGDSFNVGSSVGISTWEVTAFETTDKDRPHTRRQNPAGLDVVALGISGVRADFKGETQEVRGKVDRFSVASVAAAIHKANKPR